MDYWTLAQFQRRSLWTTKNAHNSIDNQYKLLRMRITFPIIIIYYWPLQPFHRQSHWTTKHVHNFTDNQYKLQSMHTNPPIVIKNYWPQRNHTNNHKLLNTQRVPLTITIKYWTLPQFNRQSLSITKHYRYPTNNHTLLNRHHSSNDNYNKLLKTTSILPNITLSY
jgi:hypothetical protein